MGFATIEIKRKDNEQAINLPVGMQIDDDKVYLKKVGNTIQIIPFHNPWKNMIDSLGDFSDDFMQERNEPKSQQRESLD